MTTMKQLTDSTFEYHWEITSNHRKEIRKQIEKLSTYLTEFSRITQTPQGKYRVIFSKVKNLT